MNKTYRYANITWEPLNIANKSDKWTHYFLMWMSSKDSETWHCGLVPKDQTFFLLNLSSDWYEYPARIDFNVFTYPVSKDRNTGYTLAKSGKPETPNFMIPVTFPSQPVLTTSLMAAIIVGTCIGIAFVVAVVVAWKLNVRVNTAEDIWRMYVSGLGCCRRRQIINDGPVPIVEDASKVYLSYYREDDNYMEIILPLVKALTNVGYNVIIDKMHTTEQLEEGPNHWAQTQIANSCKVIVLCSPSYIKICQQGAAAVTGCRRDRSEHNRVWFEVQMISAIYDKNKSASKMICLWMNNGVPDGLPPWMGVTYTWPQDHDKIISRLKSRNNRKSLTRTLRSSTSDNQRSYSWSVTDDDDDVFDDRLPNQQVA